MSRQTKLTLLLLDCWQREYDRRPYRNFRFKRLDFEERLQRDFHPVQDFSVIVRFLQERMLCSVYISALRPHPCLIPKFVKALRNVHYITLKLMELPLEFFNMLRDQIKRMHIAVLSLEGTQLITRQLETLREILIKSNTLKFLNLAHCNVNHNNFALIADGIHKSRSIRGFNCSHLMGNTLKLDTSKIAHMVSSLIWQNKLESIEMQHCEFIAQDIEIIAEYLYRRDSKLQKLNLSCNQIGPDGAEYLLRAIVNSGTLMHLDISRNGLGTHGGEIVAKYLSSCKRLVNLNITYNDIGAEAINLILTTIKKPLKLQTIKLYGNSFNRKSGKVLRRLLDAIVLPQDAIDVTVTYDDVLEGYRVIPYR